MPPKPNLIPFFRAWLDAALPHRQGPVLAKVETSTSSASGYRCSVSLLDAVTLEKTGEQLEDVALNAIWAGGDGAGIYALPAVGQIVVVGFIAMNRAFPFVQGAWGEGKGGAEVKDGELLLSQPTSGGGASIKLDAQGLLVLANQTESLKKLLTDLIDDLSGLKTIPAAPGSPLTLNVDDIVKIQAYTARVAKLLGE